MRSEEATIPGHRPNRARRAIRGRPLAFGLFVLALVLASVGALVAVWSGVHSAIAAATGSTAPATTRATAVPSNVPVPSTGLAVSEPVRLATIGDSITAFTDRDGNPTGWSWVRVALDQGDLLDAGGFKRWGDTTGDLLAGHTPVDADVLVVMAGTNDIYDGARMTPMRTTLDNIAALFARSSFRVGILSAVAPKDGAGAAPTLALNSELRRLARSHGLTFVDPWRAFRAADGQWLDGASADGVHPTPGSGAMVGTILREHVLREHLKRP